MENKQDKGFTLVELLIVIVILGILATVTVFAVRGITDQGQENAAACDARATTPSTVAQSRRLLTPPDGQWTPSTGCSRPKPDRSSYGRGLLGQPASAPSLTITRRAPPPAGSSSSSLDRALRH